MRRPLLALAALPLLLPAHGMAQAQEPGLREGIRFTLKPRIRTLVPVPGGVSRARMSRLVSAPADDRDQELDVMVRRQTLKLLRTGRIDMGSASALSALGPRSRFILLTAQDHIPLGDHLAITAGFQGVKLTNRGANVTAIAGNDRIRTRDWFMPRATVEISPVQKLGLSLGYQKTLHGYGETGLSGPLGLRDHAFRTLIQTLRPERQSRLRFDGRWTAAADTALTFSAFEGRIDDRLAFAGRSYLPLNGGSARARGLSVVMNRQVSAQWRVSLRYGEAWLDREGNGRAKERFLSAEAGWSSGSWRGALRAMRSSTPGLPIDAARWARRLRVEGEMRYQLPGAERTPAFLSLRLTDPDRLASTALLRDDASGPIQAADQARSLMLGVALNW